MRHSSTHCVCLYTSLLYSRTISNKQQAMKNALIEFSVKDKGKFGRNKYIGDAYLKFKDIGKSSPQNEKVVQQMQLKLTRFLTIRECLRQQNSISTFVTAISFQVCQRPLKLCRIGIPISKRKNFSKN